ncbi:hypothetical protein APHAL10511_006348 [Amanita phalloides]|nr:hypothetical protein APHAL10511_006348 [Amanita phalloides]
MSSRRLDISYLLCNDDDVPQQRPRPISTPTIPHQPPPATPKPPYLGLEALVHVATEEHRRLSGGSESGPYSYPSVHTPRQTYASLVSSPVLTQSPSYSSQRPYELGPLSQSLPERNVSVPYTRPEEELQRYQHIQRQKQHFEVVMQQEHRPQHQHSPHMAYNDTPILTLPPLRSPSMPLQVEDPEQLRSRPRSSSILHKYPSSPMQLDLPAPLSMTRGSPQLSTTLLRESPMSTAGLPAPMTPTYQPLPYHDHTNLYRRNSPSTLVREVHSPIVQVSSPPFISHRSTISEAFPPNKKRRHSNSPSRVSATVPEPTSATLSTIPPPIAAAAGPNIMSHRSNHDAKEQTDSQPKEQKVVGSLGRRSPPGSVIGRAKAAKKVDELERSLREATKRDPLASSFPKAMSPSANLVNSDSRQRDEKSQSVADFQSSESGSASAKQEETHEWFLQQFDSSHYPRQTTHQAAPPVSTLSAGRVVAVSSHTSPSPDLPQNESEPPSPHHMSEEVVATLEQELEELLTEPDETQANNKMDVDIDQTVNQLVARTLDDGQCGEEALPQANKQVLYHAEADVDMELLRLVDDRHRSPLTDDQHRQVPGLGEQLASDSQPPAVEEIGASNEQGNWSLLPVPALKVEDVSMQPPAPPTNDAVLAKNQPEPMSTEKKTTKAAGSKKKDTGSKSAKAKPANTTAKAKAKSAKSKTKTTEGTATPPQVPFKITKVPIPPPVKKSVSSTAASRSRSASVMPSGSVGPESDSKNLENEEIIDAPTDDDKLYCVCKTKYDEDRVMIACDKCDEWYHTQCVNMSDLVVDLVDQFFCPLCIQRNPQALLKTTYKLRCLNGLKHPNPGSSSACHKPALGGGILSKFCSQDCGVEYMENRIEMWVKKGGKRERLWESVKHAEKREGVAIRVDGLKCSPEWMLKTENINPSQDEEEKTCSATEKWKVKAAKSHMEVERLRNILHRVVKIREDIKKGMEVVLWRERLLDLATERAMSVGQCGWDQRLCFGDEEWREFGVGVLESYESKDESTAEVDSSMQVDGLGGVEDGEWWCPGKTMCDRHAGWQNIRSKDISREKEQKEEALAKLTTRERELRKRIEDIVDPHGQDAKGTPKKTSLKTSSTNGRPNSAQNGDPTRKGKKRKTLMQ